METWFTATVGTKTEMKGKLLILRLRGISEITLTSGFISHDLRSIDTKKCRIRNLFYRIENVFTNFYI